MASKLLRQPSQVSSPYVSGSRAQANLKKILQIIISIPSRETHEKFPLRDEKKSGFGLDLNLRLGPSRVTEESEVGYGSGACSAVGKAAESDLTKASVCNKSSEGECDPRSEEREVIEEEAEEEQKTAPSGEIKHEEEGFLGLLVEAAKLVSEEDKGAATRKEANDYDVVGRSKRGRNQVLPQRFRDSMVIMEPWKRLSFAGPQRSPAGSKKRKRKTGKVV